VEHAQAVGIPIVYGDASHEIVLEASEICTARLLVVTTPDVITAQAVITNARRCNEKLNVVARTSDSSFLSIFKRMGVSSVVLPEFETGLEMTRKSLLHFPIPVTEIQRQTESLRQELFGPFFDDGHGYKTLTQLRTAEQQFDLQWVLVIEGSLLVTRSIGGAEIRKKTGTSVVGIIRGEKLVTNPDAEFLFQANDLVAIIGTDKARQLFQAMSVPANTYL